MVSECAQAAGLISCGGPVRWAAGHVGAPLHVVTGTASTAAHGCIVPARTTFILIKITEWQFFSCVSLPACAVYDPASCLNCPSCGFMLNVRLRSRTCWALAPAPAPLPAVVAPLVALAAPPPPPDVAVPGGAKLPVKWPTAATAKRCGRFASALLASSPDRSAAARTVTASGEPAGGLASNTRSTVLTRSGAGEAGGQGGIREQRETGAHLRKSIAEVDERVQARYA